VIAAGQPLGFFAEGHRSESGQLIRGHPGVAYIAQRSNAPIIPLAVIGTKRARLGAFWRCDILIRVGEPFRAADLAVNADDPQAVTDSIMRRVAALMPEEQRGVYRSLGTAADPSPEDDFVDVVPPSEFALADRRFAEWLQMKGVSRAELADDDIRIDIVRSRDGGSAKRYRVRRAVAATLLSRRSEPRADEDRFKVADRQRTESAREEIDEFLTAIVPLDEQPYLVTDQTTVFDLTSLDADEIRKRCTRKYGVRPSDVDLLLPLWELVAKLRAKTSSN
jgi:hypothetical protein